MTGNHPFANGCGKIPEDVAENVGKVRGWLKTQPHLPQLTGRAWSAPVSKVEQFRFRGNKFQNRASFTATPEVEGPADTSAHSSAVEADEYEHIYMFLHSNYNDVELTRTTINTYFSVRTSSPELFYSRSPADADVQSVWDMLYMAPLPKTTPEGYRVLMYKLKNTDPAVYNHPHSAKAMILFSDIRVAEDGICPGYVIIGDSRGVTASHLTKINIGVLRIFMKYMQEAKPVRLKGLHIIYSAKIIDRLVSLARPFMKSELTKVLKIHTGNDLTNLYNYVPRDVLPEEYGGKAEPIEVLHERNRQLMTTKYVKWIAEEDAYVAEAVRLKALNKKNKAELEETKFRNLSID